MKKITVFLFLIISCSIHAQLVDTSHTSIYSDVSDYRNYNEVYLGNMGLAKINLLSPFEDNSRTMKNLFPNKSNSKTYTDVFYAFGSGKENYFNLQHSQKLADNLFGKATLLRTNSQGIYRTQDAIVSDFNVSLNYSPKEKRYNFIANFHNYKRNNDINGGVSDSSFFSLQDSNNANVKSTFPIQMESVVSTDPNNFDIKVLDINYNHSFRLSKTYKDSVSYFRLSQSLGYQRTKQSFYVLINNGFFTDYNYDSVSTNDSLRLEKLSHRIGLDYLFKDNVLSAGIGQNYFEYVSYSPFEVHLEHLLFASYTRTKEKYVINSQGELIVSNGKYESYSFKNSLRYVDTNLAIFNAFSANFNVLTNQPELYYSNYVSNHYKWGRYNSRNGIVQLNVKATNLKSKTSVGLNLETQSNSIYFDTASHIGQTSVSILGFSIHKEFKFSRYLFLSTSVHFQDVLASKVIEVPNFLTFNKLYFRGRIFKKQMAFNAGINLLYYSSFYSKAYNPALDEFYVQDKQKVGNYPILDVFAEFYLKKNFSFFVTATHVNSGILQNVTGKNYLATTNYPIQDRSFKLGLKWRLFD